MTTPAFDLFAKVPLESRRAGPFDVTALRGRDVWCGFVQVKRAGDDSNVVSMNHEDAGVLASALLRALEGGGSVSVDVEDCSAVLHERDGLKVVALTATAGRLEVPLAFAQELSYTMCRLAWVAHCALSIQIQESVALTGAMRDSEASRVAPNVS